MATHVERSRVIDVDEERGTELELADALDTKLWVTSTVSQDMSR